jgi:hypothetical protein
MFSLLLAWLAPVIWFGFSMPIPVFSANNPRENTGPVWRKKSALWFEPQALDLLIEKGR